MDRIRTATAGPLRIALATSRHPRNLWLHLGTLWADLSWGWDTRRIRIEWRPLYLKDRWGFCVELGPVMLMVGRKSAGQRVVG